MAIWTFLDSGVLIAGARGEDADRERALEILADSGRMFVASSFLYLEVVPKATFHKRRVETAFYDRFFRDAKWVRNLERIDEVAREMITTEKRSKPVHRSSRVKVVYLYQGR